MSGRGSHRGGFNARHQAHNAFAGNHGYSDPYQYYHPPPHFPPNPYINSPNMSPYDMGGWGGSPHQYVSFRSGCRLINVP